MSAIQNAIKRIIPGFAMTVLTGSVSVIFPGISFNSIFLYRVLDRAKF
ncbi:hypothetical protein [Methanobrevibacter sp.]